MATTLIIKNADFSANKLDTVNLADNVPCTAVVLNASTKLFTSLGAMDTLTATATPSNTTDTIVWSSSDDSVVSVVGGIITALKVGTATITATCGTQTATCAVTVNVVPSFVVIGAWNPALTSATANSTYANNVTTQSSAVKGAIISGNSPDTNLLTVSSNSSESNGSYRFVPIPIPEGAKKVRVTSNFYKNVTTRVGIKTRLLWYNKNEKETVRNYGAKCVQGRSESSFDQDDFAYVQTVDIPQNVTGLNAFALAIGADQWSLVYDTDYAEYFEVELIP